MNNDSTPDEPPPPYTEVADNRTAAGFTVGRSSYAWLDEDPRLFVNVRPPAGDPAVAHPCDIVFVVDVSGSMREPVDIKRADGRTESAGNSRLNLVQHAVNTCVHMMGPRDRAGLVAFANTAARLTDMVPMTPEGRRQVSERILGLRPDGVTSLWAGVRTGLDMIRAVADRKRNQVVMVLTDGLPTDENDFVGTHAAQVDRYRRTYGLYVQLHTFGFAVDQGASLLGDMAETGHGRFAFISDGSMVATVFVNAMAQYLSTVATEVVFRTRGGAERTVPFLLYGTPIDHVFDDSDPCVRVSVVPLGSGERVVFDPPVWDDMDRDEVSYLAPRHDLVACLEALYNNSMVPDLEHDSLIRLNATSRRFLTASAIDNPPYLQAVREDLEGEIRLAVTQRHQKWASPYLLCSLFAHRFKVMWNFKDRAPRHYEAENGVFAHFRQRGQDIFTQLAPPPPEHRPERRAVGKVVSAVAASQAAFEWDTVCFAGFNVILMADGRPKKVQDLRLGDRVHALDGHRNSTVLGIVRMHIRRAELRRVGSLVITPWHPVYVDDAWRFPADLGEPVVMTDDYVYSLVLDQGFVAAVSHLPVICLGHSYSDPGLAHAYWGGGLNGGFVADLRNHPSWGRETIQLEQGDIRRDENGQPFYRPPERRSNLPRRKRRPGVSCASISQ